MIRHPLTAVITALLLAGPVAAAPAAKPKVAVQAAPATEAPPATGRDPACVTTRSRSADGRIGYFRHCPDGPDMVSFRGGVYRMGDAIGSGQGFERPAHEVTIKPFAIGRYEVTRGEWQACVAADACTAPLATPEASEAGARHPVTSVNWRQAKAYAAWLAQRSGRPYRLPTEAEWEYAARAGSEGHYTWSMGIIIDAVTCQHANALDRSALVRHPELTWAINCEDNFAETAPVGSFAPNRWGVHDMAGNVWEWVEDCWHPDYSGAPTDGSAWLEAGDGNCKKRVNRGGGWGNGASTLRLSSRDADPAGNHSSGLGFRVAMSVAPAGVAATAAAPAEPVEAVAPTASTP